MLHLPIKIYFKETTPKIMELNNWFVILVM